MKRYGLKYRQSTYQEVPMYQLGLIGRRPVAPGEKISKLVCDTRFMSPVAAGVNLTPMLVQTWAFYCPFRLVWDEWVDFVAQDDAVPSVPTTTTAAPMYLDGLGASARNALPRRAYKLAYNQFFGDEGATSQGGGMTWFDPLQDSQTDLGALLIWDQYRSHLKERAYSSETYEAAVSGAVATLVLDDLSRALRNNRSRRRQKMTGDKYVDAMRRMGVELDWRVQMAPEFLGSSQQVVFGTERSSTNPLAAGGLGVRAWDYQGQHQFVLKRPVSFAEHGVIIICAGFRPLIARSNPSLDASMVTFDQFWSPDEASGPMENAGGGAWRSRMDTYRHGFNIIGTNTLDWFIPDTSSSLAVLYPRPTFQPLDPAEGAVIACLSDISFGGLTPVPAGVA